MAIQIFISYRRDGGDFLALHMYEVLTRAGYEVFYDIESLRSGKFNTKIYRRIEECTDFILILPKDGLDRCVDPNDWVRLEVEHAIKCEKNIVPLMMRNFVWPENLPPSLKDLPNYNGITASSELFEGVVIALEKRFLKSQKRHRVPDTEPLLIDEQDENTIIEGELDSCLFEEVKTRIGNPETNPKFRGITDIDKGRLYKYLLWAERGMRWSDDLHKALVEPFYGPNYNAACRYGYKEELDKINEILTSNIHDFIEKKMDLSYGIPYEINDPAECNGDFRYLWECILFKTQNLTCFKTKKSLFDNGIKVIASFMDEFRKTCPQWLYSGRRGLTHSNRYREFISRFYEYARKEIEWYNEEITIRGIIEPVLWNVGNFIVLVVAILLQVRALLFGWNYFHELANKGVLSNVCMYLYLLGILLHSIVLDCVQILHFGNFQTGAYTRQLLKATAIGIGLPIFGLICCMLPRGFRIMDILNSTNKWYSFIAYLAASILSAYFATRVKGPAIDFYYLRKRHQAKSMEGKVYEWRRDVL